MAQGDPPAREAEIGSVVVDGLEPNRLGRRDRDAVHDPVQVGEVKRRSGAELYLTLEHAGRR